jgi:hypothetical protein
MFNKGLASPDDIVTCQKDIVISDLHDIQTINRLELPAEIGASGSPGMDSERLAEMIYYATAYKWEKSYRQNYGLNHRNVRLGIQLAARIATGEEGPGSGRDPLSLSKIFDSVNRIASEKRPDLGGKSIFGIIEEIPLLSAALRIEVRRNHLVVENFLENFLKELEPKSKRPVYESCSLINCGRLTGRRLKGVISLAGTAFDFIMRMHDKIAGELPRSPLPMMDIVNHL